MVIGEISFASVVDRFRELEAASGREINPSVFPATEFKSKVRSGNHFLNAIMKQDKIFIIGNEDELETLLEE
jgi:hypothetical protein